MTIDEQLAMFERQRAWLRAEFAAHRHLIPARREGAAYAAWQRRALELIARERQFDREFLCWCASHNA